MIQRAVRLEYFTVGWNVLEAGVALAAGGAASSIALIGFGLDSVIETLSGLALLWRFKQRSLAEGHAEARATKMVGATFFLLAAYVTAGATNDLWNRHAPEFSLPGFILAAVSLVVMPVLGAAKRRVAVALGSRALAADATETLFCASLSATLLIGLGLNGWKGWWWADPVAGLILAGLMVREGVEACSEASHCSA
ncbi:MAG: cation diffusion facilitator family transporter [Terriglobia bacterium]